MTYTENASDLLPFDEEPKPTARELALQGERQAHGAADPFWKEEALAAVRAVCEKLEEWTVDDVWAAGLERPREGRAIAGVLRRASTLGWSEKTGRFRSSSQAQCHANPRMVWRSLIHEKG